MHVETYPAFLTPRDKEPSLSSSEEKSSEFGWLEIKRNEKWKRRKNRARLCIFYILIDGLHIWLMIWLHWMQGNIYRGVFPTFLAKKSYGWWLTRRRMEIYTKISEEKYPKVSAATIGKLQEDFAGAQNGCEISQTNKMAAKWFRSQRLISEPCEIGLQLGVIWFQWL